MLIVVLYNTHQVNCFQQNEQICEFSVKNYNLGNVNHYLYACRIKNARIEDGHTITHTEDNQRSNEDVEAVSYETGNHLRFIPNSLFVEFPNMKLLRVLFCSLTAIKPNYFQNARHLTNIRITMNPIINLESDLFAEAPNLEYISLYKNKIESVHRLCFSGLKNLQRLDLDDNKIKNLHPTTFSNLMNLQFLNLNGNQCISRNYKSVNQNFRGIQGEIKQKCGYDIINEGVESNIPVKVVYGTTLKPRLDIGANNYEEILQINSTESPSLEEKTLPVQPDEQVKEIREVEEIKEILCKDSCEKIQEMSKKIEDLTKLTQNYEVRVKVLEEKLQSSQSPVEVEEISNINESVVKCEEQCPEYSNKFDELSNSFDEKLENINATYFQNVQDVTEEFKDTVEVCKDTYEESDRNLALLKTFIMEQSKACDKKIKDSISKLEGRFEIVAKQFFAFTNKNRSP